MQNIAVKVIQVTLLGPPNEVSKMLKFYNPDNEPHIELVLTPNLILAKCCVKHEIIVDAHMSESLFRIGVQLLTNIVLKVPNASFARCLDFLVKNNIELLARTDHGDFSIVQVPDDQLDLAISLM